MIEWVISLKPPCIVVVRYVLPSIRVLIAKELIEKHGLKRSEAAKKMGMTPAAVTQYLERVRGGIAMDVVESSEEIAEMVSKTADGLIKDKISVCDVLGNICKVCRVMRSSGLLCEMHKEVLPALRGMEECERPAHLCPVRGNP